METNRGTGYRAVYDDDDELQNDDSNGGITLSPDIDCRLHYPSQCRSRDKEGRRYSVHEEPSDVPQNLRFIHYGDLLPEAVECTSRTRVSRNLLREFIKMGKSASPHKIKDASGGALLHDHAGTGQDTSRDVDAHSEAGSADSDDSTDTVTPTRTDAVSRSSSQIVSPSKLRANAPSFVPSSFKDSFDQTSEESKQPLKHLRSSSDRPDGYSSYAIPHRKSLSSGNYEEKTLFHVVDTPPLKDDTARPSTMPNIKHATSFTKAGIFIPEDWGKGFRAASDKPQSLKVKETAQSSSLLKAQYATSDNANEVLIDGKVYYTIGGPPGDKLPRQSVSTPRVRHSRMPSDPFCGTPTQPATDRPYSLPKTKPNYEAKSKLEAEPRTKFTPGINRTNARRTDHGPTAMPAPPLLAPSGLPDFPNFQLDRTAGSRVELPIPPPPLPVIRGRLEHDAATRAKLDEQKITRELWIQNSAREIADLNYAKFAAEQQYRSSGAQAELEAWQKAIAAYNDSINLDRRQEQRRSLFLPESMRPPMRTGGWSVPGDGSAAGGEGALLGFEMALMERYAAVVAESEQFLG